jgi:H2-forming N5,N10-methylenetetrahydromethanopterin dehydrogenase-like enzyme
VRDICREFSVRREWLLNGEEPIHDPPPPDESSGIEALFSQLNADNQRVVENQIQHMLNEQKELTAAFKGSDNLNSETLSSEEIRLLKALLAERKTKGGVS